MQKTSNYVLGIAAGQAAVGYAVVDKAGKLMRFKGKNMWGISWMEAAERRFLSDASSLNDDIDDLRELFADRLSALDPDFLFRVRTGDGEKNEFDGISSLMGQAFDKKTYLKACPTVYHLRKKLSTCEKRMDLRLIYLALHHILKHGGYPEEGINIYAKHKADLTLLKRLYRKYVPMKYSVMFRADGAGLKNYTNYVCRPPCCTKGEIYRTISFEFKKYADDEEVSFCFSEMRKGSFLPRLNDICPYHPSEIQEAADLLKHQSVYDPFFSEYGGRIIDLIRKRRTEWLSSYMTAVASHAVRLVKEVIKIQGLPDAVFFTYDGENEAAGLFGNLLVRKLKNVCGCTPDYLAAAVLTDIKKTCGLYDSRDINDYFYAQDAFLAASAGIGFCPCRFYMEAENSEHCLSAEEILSVTAGGEEKSLCNGLCDIRRVFGFCSFYESGFPDEQVFKDGRDFPKQMRAAAVCEKKPPLYNCRILYDGREYGVSSSGDLFSIGQLILSQGSLGVVAKLRNDKKVFSVSETEYFILYNELSDKAERMGFFDGKDGFRLVCREKFRMLAPEDRARYLFHLIEEIRANRVLEMSVETLDRNRIEIVDRSVTGLFEKKRKL